MPEYTIWANPKRYVIKWLNIELRKKYPNGFTAMQAQEFYYDNRKGPKDGEHCWVFMNARNHLCCSVQLGFLVRVSRGIYRWPMETEQCRAK